MPQMTWKETLKAAFEEMGDDLFRLRDDMPEEVTSGLEEIVDWGELEILLGLDWFESRQDFWDLVSREFERNGLKLGRRSKEAVLAGLFPEYREKYQSLKLHGGRKPVALKKGA